MNGTLYGIDTSDDTVYFIDPSSVVSGRVAGRAIGTLPSTLTGPNGAATHSGTAYIADQGQLLQTNDQALWSVDPTSVSGGVVSATRIGSLPSGLVRPGGLASLGERLFAINQPDLALWEITPGTVTSGLVQAARLGTLRISSGQSLAMAGFGGALYVADYVNDELWSVNPDVLFSIGGERFVSATRIGSFPSGLTFPESMVSHG